MYVNRCIQC